MKKFVVFFLLCSCLFCVSLFKKDFDFGEYKNLKVQIFTSNKCNSRVDDVTYVENGNGQILVCDFDTYKQICKSQDNISGVTFVFDGNKEIFLDIIKKLNVSSVELNDTSFVGYTNYFDKSVKYQNKKVNVQGYFDGNNKIYIGTPLLLGSY